MNKGLFITIEGTDGSGKSTQIEGLKKYFEENNYKAIFTREPGGTKISEKIRNIILDKENVEMSDMTETLLYAAARAQLVEQVIKPALANGEIVICDRYIDSSIAYQGFGRGLGKSVEDINMYAINQCKPDITFLLKVNPSISKKRLKYEEMDRLEQEKLEFHKSVYEGYLELEKNNERILGIDGTLGIEEIRGIIISKVEELLREKGLK